MQLTAVLDECSVSFLFIPSGTDEGKEILYVDDVWCHSYYWKHGVTLLADQYIEFGAWLF